MSVHYLNEFGPAYEKAPVRRPVIARKAIRVTGPDGVSRVFAYKARGDSIFTTSNLTGDWWTDLAIADCRKIWGDGELVHLHGTDYSWKEFESDVPSQP